MPPKRKYLAIESKKSETIFSAANDLLISILQFNNCYELLQLKSVNHQFHTLLTTNSLCWKFVTRTLSSQYSRSPVLRHPFGDIPTVV